MHNAKGLCLLVLTCAACASARPAPGSEARILTIADGRVIRGSAFG